MTIGHLFVVSAIIVARILQHTRGQRLCICDEEVSSRGSDAACCVSFMCLHIQNKLINDLFLPYTRSFTITHACTLIRGFPLILWWQCKQTPFCLWLSYSALPCRGDLMYSWKLCVQIDHSILMREINYVISVFIMFMLFSVLHLKLGLSFKSGIKHCFLTKEQFYFDHLRFVEISHFPTGSLTPYSFHL